MAEDSFKLSKNLLRMKFMQRGLDAETKKQLDEDEKRIISDEHWHLDLPELKSKENRIVEEKSFRPCEELLFGRLSFRGFNPEVEVRFWPGGLRGKAKCRPSLVLTQTHLVSQKLMALMNPKDEVEEDVSQMQTDVTDEEMALRYESLVGTMKKKFAKKRERRGMDEDDQNLLESNTKRVFLKPRD
uniref:M-phase phosphoprotein 6 n=2 Tax=Nothobranchius TaxID=28779 RepID=A0A1A8M077_9TELE